MQHLYIYTTSSTLSDSFPILFQLFFGSNPHLYDNMAGQVDRIINCGAIFYEEGKGGENFCKKNKFRCKVNPNEERVVKLCETIR